MAGNRERRWETLSRDQARVMEANRWRQRVREGSQHMEATEQSGLGAPCVQHQQRQTLLMSPSLVLAAPGNSRRSKKEGVQF